LNLWGARSALKQAAVLHAAAAGVRSTAKVSLLDEQVAIAFSEAVAAGWNLAAAERLLVAFDRALIILAERRDAGDASGLDLRRAQLERTRALAVLVGARHARHSATARLASLISAPSGSLDTVELVLDIEPGVLPAFSIDSLLLAAHQTPGDALALELEHRAAVTMITAASRAKLPVPSLRLGGKWISSADGLRQGGLVAGLSVPLPIWNRGDALVDAAMAAEVGVDALWDASRRDLEVEVRTAWEGLNEHAEPLAALAEALQVHGPAMRDAIDVAFSEGELDVTAWLDALRTEHETRTLYNDLWAELVARMGRLERLTGLNLFRGGP